jgi:bla regulator protein BlaR1
LTPPQLEAVLAHELCHIRRRDNLVAAVHMVVEALFWFHPLVWWIGARLVEERERACDEHVLSVFGEPRTYAEGIVNVCRQYVEAPLACVSGVSGAHLKQRVEEIMTNRIVEKLNVGRKMLLAGVGIVAVAGPIVVGIGARQVRAQSPEGQPAGVAPAFEVASIKPSDVGGNYVEITPGTVSVHSATLRTCITWAYSVQRSQVAGANATISRMLDSGRYDIVAKSASPVPVNQLKQMLQQLLADRFTMTLHRDHRELQTYALLQDKGGAKFRESSEEGESVERAASKMNRQWTRTRMAQFADQLSEAMEAPVLDETGLTSKYDFALDLTPYLQRNGERPDIATMMVTAIKEQLGLRLASRRAPVDVFVIDHVEKPSAN